jgi:hypothetical protein
MGKVIAAITTSVDGYIVGPQDGPESASGASVSTTGYGWPVDVRRRRPRHRRYARRGPGVLRVAHRGAGLRDRRPQHVRRRRHVGRHQPVSPER